MPVIHGKAMVLASLFLFFFTSCWKDDSPSLADLERETFTLRSPSGQSIRTSLALRRETQIRGLSGVRAQDFPDDGGLLFVFLQEEERSFWMPDTYFDLDIIFLDKNLKVVGLERNVPHHPGRAEPPPIYSTANYWAKYVLEIKARSPLSAQIDRGDTLIWDSAPTLEEIERQILGPRN